MFKTSIAALAAAPLLASGAAFAGPYVNLEATGSYLMVHIHLVD